MTQRSVVVRRWLLPVVAVVILVAVVALAGGFRTAQGTAGPPAEPGEQIDLERWEVTVDEVELTNLSRHGAPRETTNLRVYLTLTFTGEQSLSNLPTGLLTVEVPDGTPAGTGYGTGAGQWSSAVDPHQTLTYVVDFDWPLLDDDGEQPPLPEVPDTVDVVVHDEIYAEGPLFGWEWGIDDVAAVVTVPVTDARVEVE